MKYFYGILAILGILFGFIFLAGAKSAIHEIEAFIIFLIAAVLMACAEIAEISSALQKNQKKEDLRVEPTNNG